jgi:TetR/AcrR family transcriptional regulator, tetracycline repressor protein
MAKAGQPLDPKQLAKLAWQDGCRLLARSMFDVLSRHRGAAKLLIDSVPTGPNAMLQRERSLAVLLANGFSPARAARTYATLARYVLGFAIQLVDKPRASTFPKLDKASFPATFAVAHALPIPLDDEFAFGLELMRDGLSRK